MKKVGQSHHATNEKQYLQNGIKEREKPTITVPKLAMNGRTVPIGELHRERDPGRGILKKGAYLLTLGRCFEGKIEEGRTVPESVQERTKFKKRRCNPSNVEGNAVSWGGGANPPGPRQFKGAAEKERECPVIYIETGGQGRTNPSEIYAPAGSGQRA